MVPVGAEAMKSIGELTQALEASKLQAQQAEAAAASAHARADELGAARDNLNRRVIEVGRLLQAQGEVVYGAVVTHYAGSQAPLAEGVLAKLDSLRREHSLLSQCYAVLLFRSAEANSVYQVSEAEAGEARGKLMEAEAALAEGNFYAKLQASGCGAAVIRVDSAPHTEMLRAAADFGLRAMRILDDRKARLAEFRERNADNLRLALR